MGGRMQKDNKVHHYWAGTTIPEEEYNVLEMTRVSLFILQSRLFYGWSVRCILAAVWWTCDTSSSPPRSSYLISFKSSTEYNWYSEQAVSWQWCRSVTQLNLCHGDRWCRLDDTTCTREHAMAMLVNSDF